MLLLHISDIHFKDPICHTPMDPALPYRTALIQDVRKRLLKLGQVQAILVTGDVAFHGWASEYKEALTWLTALSEACGCPVANILVVPGNHDVDRYVILNKANVRNAHKALLDLRDDPKDLDEEFLRQVYDPEVSKVLLEPVQSYNEFAARFACQLYLPEQLFWIKDFPLDGSFKLRINGLTSTLFSGAGAPNREEDKRGSLYISPYQTAFNPAPGVVALVMGHHPPDWFIDQDAVDEALRERVTIHLFGHKHRQRVLREDRYVRFSAGAVNPEQYEPSWEPGYNLIGLTVNSIEGRYFLEIESHVLIWQTDPGLFRLKEFRDSGNVFQHKILLTDSPFVHEANLHKNQPNNKEVTEGEQAKGIVMSPLGTEADVSDARTRNLVFRFWELSSSQRREITLRLSLIDETEVKLPEPERYGRAFLRAKERGLVERLADEIARMEKR